MTDLKRTTTLFLFLGLLLLSLLLGEMTIYFLDINSLIYKDLSEQLTLKQLEELFKNKAQWGWVSYAIMPIVLFMKITLIAWILAIGGFFHEIHLSHHKYFWAALPSLSGLLLLR